MMAMAVYPHADQPFAFGLHQCSRARTWTPEEERLLQEIGRRLADGLTSRFVLRSLRESEGRLAEAQRVAHVGHWERDLTGGHVTVSPELLRIFGLGPDYHARPGRMGRASGGRWCTPTIGSSAAAALDAALRGGPRYDVEYRVVRADGQERVVHSQGDAIDGGPGRPRRMFGTVQDITEFRRAQDELRASESRFRVFVDHATDAFFLHGRGGAILDVNQQACDSLGYTRDELVGMSPAAIDIDTDFENTIGSRLESGAGAGVRLPASPEGRIHVSRRSAPAPLPDGGQALRRGARARHHAAQGGGAGARRELQPAQCRGRRDAGGGVREGHGRTLPDDQLDRRPLASG